MAPFQQAKILCTCLFFAMWRTVCNRRTQQRRVGCMQYKTHAVKDKIYLMFARVYSASYVKVRMR